MDTTVIFIVVAAAAVLWSFVLLGKAKSAGQRASAEAASRQAVEGKLNGLRQEISALKDENQRKTKSLEEARESAKKKLRKEAQKSDSDFSEDTSTDSETGRLKRTLSAMESQIRSMKEEGEQSINSAKAALDAAHQKQISSLNDQIEKLEEQLSAAKGETNRRRQNLSKQMAAPVDLSTLPTEVVTELARLMRKSEQHEKMHGILQGKHQLAQERYQELQRRYFAVCRELALVALPNSDANDEQARQFAESVVEASDAKAVSEKAEAPRESETPNESMN